MSEATSEDYPGETERVQPQGAGPRMIGNYHLMQKIGEGGMGEVYVAEQVRPVRRKVALKIIKPGMDSREVVARFEAERQALALMDHPSIAKVFDAGMTEQGRCFFAMEYVQGIPITEYCNKHRLSSRQRLQLFVQVCDAVNHAHQKAIIHRDLKPSNLLVALQDGSPAPKVIDFGLAKAMAQRLTELTIFTELGQLMGTPEYMSPEQAEMTAENIDTRSDIYSLGVVLYELLVGTLPFDSRQLRSLGLAEVRRRIREDEPQRPSARLASLEGAGSAQALKRGMTTARLQSELRGDLDWITMKALEKDRSRRYGTVLELAADLQRFLRDEPVLARPPSVRYRMSKFVRRHRIGVSVAAGLLGVLIVFAVTMAVQARRIGLERDRANREAETARAVSGFLVELFQVSDPDAARGNRVTARELLDVGARRVESELWNEPLTQARLMDVMGRVYQSLALYDEALPLHERALEIRRRELGDSDPEVAESLSGLANVYSGQAHLNRAEPLYRQALALCEVEFGPDDPRVAEKLQELAQFLGSEHFDESKFLYERALAIRRQTFGASDPRVAHTLRGLGMLHGGRGKYEDAERFYKEALGIYGTSRAPDHPDVGRVLANLSNLYWGQGRLTEARSLLERTLAIREKAYGPDHLFVAYSLEDLGLIDQDEGRFAKAASLYERSLAIKERALGPDHPRVAMAVGNLGSVLIKMGDYDRARSLLERCLRIMENSYGPNNLDLAGALQIMGELERRAGNPDKAIPVLRRALAIQEKNFEGDNAILATTLHDLGVALRDIGNEAEAENILGRALTIREQALPPGSPYVAESMEEYAKLLRQTRREVEAEALETRAHAIRATAGS